MDDDSGYPHDYGNPHIGIEPTTTPKVGVSLRRKAPGFSHKRWARIKIIGY